MTIVRRAQKRFLVLGACLLLAGCGDSSAQSGPPAPPEVLVSEPVHRTITDQEEFPGRIEAVNAVEIRARVTGYLETVNFQEGADVKQGDLLFAIDSRSFQAELARAEANVAQAEAHAKRLDSDYARAATLLSSKAIQREEFDKVAGDRQEAHAAVVVAQATRDLAKLNLSFTKVTTPLSGRVSRRFIDPGNLVKADDTVLTTVIALDKVYAYFDLDERTTLRFQRLIRAGKIKWSLDAGLPISVGLADESDFPRQGTINFADNRVDADTGTWRLRGLLENPDRALSPGLFVRVRMRMGQPYQAILVAEKALGMDQGQRFVYVVDPEGTVAYRRVQVGRQDGGLRVISDGLRADEHVVVSGLQRVKPGAKVTPKVVEMPDQKARGKATGKTEPPKAAAGQQK